MGICHKIITQDLICRVHYKLRLRYVLENCYCLLDNGRYQYTLSKQEAILLARGLRFCWIFWCMSVTCHQHCCAFCYECISIADSIVDYSGVGFALFKSHYAPPPFHCLKSYMFRLLLFIWALMFPPLWHKVTPSAEWRKRHLSSPSSVWEDINKKQTKTFSNVMIFWQCSNEDFATPKGESPPATVQCKEILCVHWISPGRKWITSQGFGRKQAEWDWVKVWEKTGVKGWTYWTLCNEWNFPGGSSLNCPEPENEKVKPWWKSLYQLQYKCRVEDHYFGFSEALICLTLPFQDNRFKENSWNGWLFTQCLLTSKTSHTYEFWHPHRNERGSTGGVTPCFPTSSQSSCQDLSATQPQQTGSELRQYRALSRSSSTVPWNWIHKKLLH